MNQDDEVNAIVAISQPIKPYQLLNIQRRTFEFVQAKIHDPDNEINWNLKKKYRNKLSVIDDMKNSHYIINNYRNLPVKNINKNSVIPPNYKIFYEIKIDGVPINTIYKKVK